MGISQGTQTISRGEVTADFLVCQSADLSTDSKMSSNQHHSRARIFPCMASGCKVANFDLVSRLAAFWSKDRFCVFKVKSHQCWLETRTLLNADWHLEFLSQIKWQPCPSRDVHLTFYSWQQAFEHKKLEASLLETAFAYLIDLNKERHRTETEELVLQAMPSQVSYIHNLMSDSTEV